MIRRLNRVSVFVVFSLLALTAVRAPCADELPAERDKTADSGKKGESAKGADRDELTILTDLRAAKEELSKVMANPGVIADDDFRKQDGPKAVAELKKVAELLKELAASEQDEEARQGLIDDRYQHLALLSALGDDDTTAMLEKDAAAKGPTKLTAQSALALAKWWRHSKDAAAQEKILTEYSEIAKANPKEENPAETLAVMARVGAANDEVASAAVAAMRKLLTSDTAKKLAAELDPQGALRELVGKPLVVSGRTSTAKTLTTADLKGKVVLVDFWATWCGPCNAELPHVKEVYKAYHDKGLEIVGVDCDADDETVNSFIKEKDMPWAQLREESQSEQEPWHPLATSYGVGGIPTMFLIDKKGTLRFIDAREDTAEKIEKLLAE